jgi:hypothetical protein
MARAFGRASQRRHDLDWLRVIGIYLLFPIHAAIVFSPLPFYHVRNAKVTLKMTIFLAFVEPWIMPLFFVMAGWGMYHSLRRRGSWGFLKQRVLKLFIPLLVGCAILMPPIKYVELRSGFDANFRSDCQATEYRQGFGPCIPEESSANEPFNESFWTFLPTFFTRFERFTWSHLWFVGYLFVLSVVYLPLMSWLARGRRRFRPKGTAWIYLPLVPLLLTEIVLRPRWPGLQHLYKDWANVATFSIYLLSGFLLARHPALEEAIQREWRRALALCLGGVVVRVLLGVRVYLGFAAFNPPILWSVPLVIASWGGVVGLLGFARSRLCYTNAALDYLRPSAYPVYFLHELAVVGIGYWVVRLPLGIPAKYALLLVASFTATMAAYHLAVRPLMGAGSGARDVRRRPAPLEGVCDAPPEGGL